MQLLCCAANKALAGMHRKKKRVLLNLYSTIILAEKKLWIVQDVEA